MSDNLLVKLKKLRRERSDTSPFPTHLEFQKWADDVSPLLAFDSAIRREFDSLVTTIQVTRPFRNESQEIININNLIGLLNKAVALLENQPPKELIHTLLQAPDNLTLKWIWNNAHWSFYPLCFATLSGMFVLGYNFSSIVAATQNSALNTSTEKINEKPQTTAAPTASENIKPKETPAQAKSSIAGAPQ